MAPDSFQARTSLGLALSGRGRHEEALPHLEEAARLGPDFSAPCHNVGNCLRLLGRMVEARASYLKAIRIDPGAALSYFHVGMTLLFEGSLNDTLRWYKLAVEMDPQNPDLWEELADLHLKRDEPDEAVTCRQRILDLSPADPLGARIELGWALQEDGRPDEAMEQYRIALKCTVPTRMFFFGTQCEDPKSSRGDRADISFLTLSSRLISPSFGSIWSQDRSPSMRLTVLKTLQWVIAVAVTILLIYGGIGGIWLWRRHNYFSARADEYSEKVSELQAWQQQLISESKKGDPSHDRWFTYREIRKARAAGEVEYASEMARKYRRAARFPWLSVEQELPEPW